MDNLLVHGDNLPTLLGLQSTHRGLVRCVYMDPPYNTGQRQGQGEFAYKDSRESSAYLDFLGARVEACLPLMAPDGHLFIQLDDNELDYVKVHLDGLLGREQFIARITVDARAPSAFSTVNKGLFKASEYLLWYCKDRSKFESFPVRVPRAPDSAYRMWLDNPKDLPEQWTLSSLSKARPADEPMERFQVRMASRVARLASISDTKAGKATLEAKARSKANPQSVVVVKRPGRETQYLLRGQQLLFYGKQVQEIDGQRTASRPLTNVWTDIAWEGIAGEGKVRLKGGKKPERLLRRVLQLSTQPGDWVLDPFLGSGTCAAVAHKMGRSWIGVEQGPVAHLAKGRLERVVAGQDPTGVSRVLGWRGGGAFVFQALGDSAG
ncbi:MAG: adenine-specific DNA-methyltransferase [Cognaticolwellia sp.]|jgi:adenine-specific DNA-methyltransferase